MQKKPKLWNRLQVVFVGTYYICITFTGDVQSISIPTNIPSEFLFLNPISWSTLSFYFGLITWEGGGWDFSIKSDFSKKYSAVPL